MEHLSHWGSLVYDFLDLMPHQWPSGSALRTGGTGFSTSSRACRPNRLAFSVVFSETCLNMGYNPLERPAWRALSP